LLHLFLQSVRQVRVDVVWHCLGVLTNAVHGDCGDAPVMVRNERRRHLAKRLSMVGQGKECNRSLKFYFGPCAERFCLISYLL
jgi:hypothetical protein